MNISDAKLWAEAFVLAEKILSLNDRETLVKRGSVQAMLMLAFMEGCQYAENDSESTAGKS